MAELSILILLILYPKEKGKIGGDYHDYILYYA